MFESKLSTTNMYETVPGVTSVGLTGDWYTANWSDDEW